MAINCRKLNFTIKFCGFNILAITVFLGSTIITKPFSDFMLINFHKHSKTVKLPTETKMLAEKKILLTAPLETNPRENHLFLTPIWNMNKQMTMYWPVYLLHH